MHQHPLPGGLGLGDHLDRADVLADLAGAAAVQGEVVIGDAQPLRGCALDLLGLVAAGARQVDDDADLEIAQGRLDQAGGDLTAPVEESRINFSQTARKEAIAQADRLGVSRPAERAEQGQHAAATTRRRVQKVIFGTRRVCEGCNEASMSRTL
jgi:hypothetical protein